MTDHTNRNITLDVANAGMAKISLPRALATLQRFANMDTGKLYIALGDGYAFYTGNAVRPEGKCTVWVMAGAQPITSHGIESDDAYSSACAMIMGLKIAKAFGGSEPALQGLGKPWLDDLSLVMLRAKSDVPAAPGSIPLAEELYNRAISHGVDMTAFRVYDDCEEHF